MNDDSDDDSPTSATLTSIHAGESIDSFSVEGYDPHPHIRAKVAV